MLLLDARSAVIDGVSVFPDHHDPEQWYYLPTSPHLTTVRDDATGLDVPQLLLLAFRGDELNGGMLSFDCNVGLAQADLDRVAQRIATSESLARPPRLAPVPLVDGTVRLLMLGARTGAEPPEEPVPPGQAPPFVVQALHHARPSLFNDNQAAFSVQLTPAGYAAVRGTLDAVIMPIAVVYSLEFLGLRPAYRVSLAVDWDRVQRHLDERFSAKVWVLSTEIASVVDELVEDRAIVLEADTFVPEDTEGVIDRRDAALAQVRAMITTAFFEPSLPPWTPEEPEDWERALRLVGELAATQARAAAGGPAASAPVSFGYTRTDVTRIDRKSLDVTFSERTTVRRTIHPQGHLASLFSVVARSPELMDRLVREVTVDAPFFDKRTLQAVYRPALGVDAIDSINVRARYAGRPRNVVLTGPPWTASFEWLSDVRDGVVRREVDLSYEVHFKDADATERPTRLAAPERVVTDDVVPLTPEDEVFAIRPVAVLADHYPWDRYTSVEVHLHHQDPASGIDERELIRLTPEHPDGLWREFVVDREHTAYQVRLVHRAVDHRDVDTGWRPSDEEQVTVRNPFPHQRVLDVVPNVSWDTVSEIFVDVRYEDPAHDVVREDTLTLTRGSPRPRFVVDLRDPTRTAVQYTVGMTFADGRSLQLPPSVTHERRIFVSPDMRGHRVVEVRAPAGWVARSVKRITVELRYEDFLENLVFAGTVELEGPDATGRFEFDYVEETRNRYEYRYTVLHLNGLSRDVPWRATAAAEIVPELG